jgi:microcystin-dependent protein
VSEPILGSIMLFAGNFAPRGWALCEGQILPISQNTALFSILGTTYGGDGTSNFALPDLRGRAPVGWGQGPGLSDYVIGETGGAEDVTLLETEIPAHTHNQPATAGAETTNRPNAAIPAEGGVYAATSDGSQFAATTSAGGGQPHENRTPYLAMTYVIALEGIFPSRN